jgi:hypothetical protein
VNVKKYLEKRIRGWLLKENNLTMVYAKKSDSVVRLRKSWLCGGIEIVV